jgi:hypothetical protein
MRNRTWGWAGIALSLWLAACSGESATSGDAGGEAEGVEEAGGDVPDAAPEDGGREDGRAEDGEVVVEATEDAGAEDAADEGPACVRTTDPLTLWREKPEINMVGSGPLTRLGNLEGPCIVDGYRVVAARGMRLRFEAHGEAASRVTSHLAFYGASALSHGTGAPIAEAVGAPGFTAILEVTITRSGEHLLLLNDLELEDAGSYALNASCLEGCSLRATRFPIVLMHGFGG